MKIRASFAASLITAVTLGASLFGFSGVASASPGPCFTDPSTGVTACHHSTVKPLPVISVSAHLCPSWGCGRVFKPFPTLPVEVR